MDRLDGMKVFIVALEEGSLAAAARALKRSPAAISRAIAALEASVGAPLLHRTTRSMRPSPAGEQYAVVCRRVLADLEEAELVVRSERATPSGTLTISAPPVVGEEVLRPIIEAFLREHPSVSVRMLLLDRQVNLVDEGVDVTLRIGNLPDSSLVAIKVGADVRRVVAAAPSYLADHARIDGPADLAKHQIVALANFGLDSWSFPPAPGSVASRTVNFTPRIVVNSVRAAVLFAANGLGVTRLYAFHVADKVREQELEIILAQAEPTPVAVHLVAQRVRMQAPRVRAFVDFAVPRLRAELSWLGGEAGRLDAVRVRK